MNTYNTDQTLWDNLHESRKQGKKTHLLYVSDGMIYSGLDGVLGCFEDNSGAIAVLRKAGFQQAGKTLFEWK